MGLVSQTGQEEEWCGGEIAVYDSNAVLRTVVQVK